MAWHLSSVEYMFLLLNKTICNSLIQVKYLPTEPLNICSHSTRPISTISDDNDDPYWKDAIEKYFAQSYNEQFDNMTYPDYFRNYCLLTKNLSNNNFYKNDLNYIVKRNSPLLIHYRYLKI